MDLIANNWSVWLVIFIASLFPLLILSFFYNQKMERVEVSDLNLKNKKKNQERILSRFQRPLLMAGLLMFIAWVPLLAAIIINGVNYITSFF